MWLPHEVTPLRCPHSTARSMIQGPFHGDMQEAVTSGQAAADEIPDSDDEQAMDGHTATRADALGPRCSLEGLSKVSREATGTIYELCLGC